MQLNRSCAHILTTGDSCGAYALRDSDLCYWHHKARESREDRATLNRRHKTQPTGLVLPLLEDANSIQLAIQMVAQAIADRRISRAEAGTLLYSIQLAIINLKHVQRPESVYVTRMLVVPTKGDDHEDLGTSHEIPIEEDPEFDEDGDDLKSLPAEFEVAETFVNKNLHKLQRLGVG